MPGKVSLYRLPSLFDCCIQPPTNSSHYSIIHNVMCQETMQALREGAPNVREELSAMENLTQVDVGSRKRGQGDISGNVEEQPQRPRHDFLAIAQERAQRMIQNNAEDEEAASSTGEGDAAPKRVQVQWRTRFDQLVSCSVIHQLP